MRIRRSLTGGLLAAGLLLGAAACGRPATPAQPRSKVVPAVAPAEAVMPTVAPAKVAPPAPVPASPPPAIPILMYHVIEAPPANAPFPGLYVTPATFAAQMAALHDAGYQA